jgi:4-carboxymuconolactone decarboxylase
MNSTSHADRARMPRRTVLGLIAMLKMTAVQAQAAGTATGEPMPTSVRSVAAPLTPQQLAIGPIAASMAVGDMPSLSNALNRGLDAGLTLNAVKEVLVQLYAYAGFPRSLNALAELMKVVDDRKQRGLADKVGFEPRPTPTGDELLRVGTANQTQLSGAPVRGPLFEFAPAIDRFLKTHLFGDIFSRDNLDWTSRELATVAALSAMQGVESQLLSHVRISLNVGITPEQLRQFADTLTTKGVHDAGRAARGALAKHLAQTAAKR